MAAAWRPRSAGITPNLPPGRPRSSLECALAPRHERAPGEAQDQQRDRVDREHDLQRAPRTHLDRLAFRLVEVHHLHHAQRSEEHTSELQSLMRTSYAVFCLKKKN